MAKIADLVKALAGGPWTIVGSGTPIEETKTIPNPYASNPVPPAGAPTGPEITTGTGRYYVVVQDSEGHQRGLFLTPSTDQGVTGPELTPAPPITGRDPAPGTRVVAGNELANLEWEPGAALGDVPAGSTTKQPSATNQLDRIDARGNVIPPGDTTTKPAKMRDPSTGTVFDLPSDPNGTLHDLGNDVILVKPDGSYATVATKPKEPAQFNVPGVGLVEYDPSKPEGQRSTVLIKAPATNDPKTEIRNGTTYQYDPDTKQWIKTDLPAQQDVGYTYNDPNSDQIIFYDKQGKEISRTTKPNWKAPVNVQPGTAPAADLVSDTIPTFDPQTGQLKFVPNQNQLKASDATSQIAQQLGLKVAAGSMSEKQAQDIITGAVNAMNAQTSQQQAQAQQQQNVTTAAGQLLTSAREGATTGAGLLQNRVTAATGALNNILGIAGQNKNLMAAPAGLGEQLVGGLQGWTADLMGGQGVLDSAARMVQAADPKSDMMSPETHTAVGVLAQMLDKWQQLTGQPHPAVSATQAANATATQGGITAPATAAAPPPAAAAPTTAGVSSQRLPINQAVMPGYVNPWLTQPPPAPGFGGGPGFVAPVAGVPAPQIAVPTVVS